MRKILHLVKKEFLQLSRDRTMVMILIGMPILQLLILGYVVSADIKNIKTVLCDLDNSSLSRSIAQRLDATPYFTQTRIVNSLQGAQTCIDRGEAEVGLIIADHFSADLSTGRRTELGVLVDGQDVNTATIALGYLNGILDDFLTEQIEIRLLAYPELADMHVIRSSYNIRFNPDLKNSVYMIPGIIVFLLTLITSGLSAASLVREREIGTLEQLMVSPLKKHEIILGKIIPFAIIGLGEALISLAFARVWYHIPMAGNLFLFLGITLAYLFTTLGMGLLTSVFARTQQQALFMNWFVMLFVLLMSGFMFPIENMPAWAQYLSYLNPMRYLMLVVRELFIKGAGIQHLYGQALALVFFGGFTFTLALLRLQKRMN